MAIGWPFGGGSRGKRARAAERHDASGLRCALGDLVDLSTSGMRIRGSGKTTVSVGQMLPLMICNDGQCIRVQCTCVWVKKPKIGGGTYELGVRFIDLRPGVVKAIEQMARFGCITTTGMGEVEQAKPTQAPAASESNAGSSAASGSGNGSGSAGQSKPSSGASAGSVPTGAKVEVENLYAILGVEMDADTDAIKRAFHALALKMHPDKNEDPDAADKFAMINKCYMVLKDPQTRAKYDQLLKRSA
jgi:DnaJ-domain-containing protein 1